MNLAATNGSCFLDPRSSVLALMIALLSTSIDAQWVRYPTAGVPRTRDGNPNLPAPAPPLPNGKPDFSGVWSNDAYGAWSGDTTP